MGITLHTQKWLSINFTLAPNPATEFVTASFDLISENDVAELTVTDMTGRKVFYKKATEGQREVQLDLRKLSKAGYIVELRINGTLIGRNKFSLELKGHE